MNRRRCRLSFYIGRNSYLAKIHAQLDPGLSTQLNEKGQNDTQAKGGDGEGGRIASRRK